MIDTISAVDTTDGARDAQAIAQAVLRRVPANYTQRRVAFYNAATRQLALDTGRSVTLTLDSDRASDLLAFVARLPERERPRMVFLCGGDSSATTPADAWWNEPIAQGWNRIQEHREMDRKTAVFNKGGREGVTIDLRMAAPWFGASLAAMDPELCLAAWRRLQPAIRGAFSQQRAALMATPAMTGRELFAAAMPYGVEVAPLSEDVRDHLREISTQGRIEIFSPFTRTISDLFELDARWGYAACLHHLPVGPMVMDGINEFAGYTPGFYFVEARVPSNWDRIGLLPDWETFDAPTPIRYPRRPRKRFTSWAGGAEIQLARENGWDVRIHQRILWPETQKRPDVAKTWRSNLVSLRALMQYGALAKYPESDLMAGAVRHILIDTIGSWNSTNRPEYGTSPSIDLLPPGAIPHLTTYGVEWERYVELTPRQLRFAHPEWAGTVWSRMRRRLALKALTLPLHSLVALRTDGIWTTANPGDLAYADESTDPGAWRVKSYLQGPEFWPHNEAQLRELMRRARGGEGE